MKKLLPAVIVASVGLFALPRFSEGSTIRVPADYPTIQAGISAASSGDTVLVAAGTYHENNIRMKAGVVIKGAGIDLSIVDGDGETVFWGADDATLEGFTITNASGSSNDGIFCWTTTPTISNNKITKCSSGISVADNAIIKNNIIVANSDYGIFCGSNSSPLITQNLIVDSDGALVSVSSDLIAYNNTIHKNSRGLWIQKSRNDTTAVEVTATNNIISGNSWYGVYLASGTPHGVDPAYMTITYNDVWNNSPNYSSNWSPDPTDISHDPMFVNPGVSKQSLNKLPDFEIAKIIEKNETHNAIKIAQNEQFLESGAKKINVNNIVAKYDFMQVAQIDPSDYYLQEGSPCIDAGDPTSPLDPDGTRADMGAFYYDQSRAVDPEKTTVTANPDTIPADGISISTITVTPRDSLGNNPGTGQTVALATTAGTLLDTMSDNGDGTYTQELQSSTTPGTAIITATVNGIEMDQKPSVVFMPISAAGMRIDPSQVNVGIGNAFTVAVVIDSATDLGSFQFDIKYSTSVVHADSAWLGPFLGSSGRTASPVGPTIDNSSEPGKITFGGFSFGSSNGPEGSGILAIVKFSAQDTGSTIFDLKNVQATDINGQALSVGAIGDCKAVVSVPSVPIFLSASSPQFAGNEFWVDINVGNANNPVSNLLGVSFALEFTQTNFIDVVAPHSGNAIPGPFLGTDVIFIQTVDEATGKVSIGMSRKAGQGGVSGHGTVARVKFIANANTPDGTRVIFSVTDLTANDPVGLPIPLNPDSLIVTINRGAIVWPGDTNNDGVVNQADILRIGLHWGKTGPARDQRGCTWNGWPARPWNPLNATYADANGDGIVNQADVLCIGLNWGRTHSTGTIAVNQATILNKQTAANLEMKINGDTNPGDEFFIEIYANEVSNLFGISFEFVYDPTTFLGPILVDSTGNLLGGDLLFVSNIDTIAGRIGIGLSGKSGAGGVSGSGLVSRIKTRMSNHARIGLDTTWLSIENVQANDSAGNSIEFDVTNVTLFQLVTDVETAQNNTIPDAFVLHQNYPNPFNPETTIQYQLPKTSQVELVIYNLAGRRVATLVNKQQPAGIHFARWNGKDDSGRSVASGVYLYRLETKKFVQIRKMALVR